jgi:hypothetical protein
VRGGSGRHGLGLALLLEHRAGALEAQVPGKGLLQQVRRVAAAAAGAGK